MSHTSEHPEAAAKGAQVTFSVRISDLGSKEHKDQGAGVRSGRYLSSPLVRGSSSQRAGVNWRVCAENASGCPGNGAGGRRRHSRGSDRSVHGTSAADTDYLD